MIRSCRDSSGGGNHGWKGHCGKEVCGAVECALVRKGKGPARRLLKARILLKADVSEGGPGWSDSKIIAALDTSASMLYRVRKQLLEEGFEAVLSRKQRATPAVARIFDGEKEAKLIALACSKP